ncbi:MAG: type II secretion system F family protein [bacterium]|nr:type II secretion system F family protein [bacterium]
MRHIFRWLKLINILNYWFKVRVSQHTLITIIRQLALMIKMDLPITEGLAILTQDLPRFSMKGIKRIISDIEEGSSISEAFKKHPRLFPELYLPMIKIGEQSGNLPRMLNLSAEYLEQTRQIKQKIGIALVYPAQLIFIAIGIFVFISSFVMSTFENIYLAFECPLPHTTRIVFNYFAFFTEYLFPLLFIFGIIFLVLILTRRLIVSVERVFLLLPFWGQLWRKKAEIQFCQLFSALIEEESNTIYCLELTKEGIWNKYLKYKLEKVLKSIKGEGKGIGEAFVSSKGFSKTLVWMIQLGEQSENLPQAISLTAQTYQEDVDILTTRLTTSIEPLIHLVMAIFIGIMIIATYLPIFGLSELVLNYIGG